MNSTMLFLTGYLLFLLGYLVGILITFGVVFFMGWLWRKL